jgi:hypothetical protein
MSTFFNGRLITSPATVSMVDDSAMANKSANVGNVLALIGSAKGGKPKTALRFASPAEARAVLGSCEATKAIEKSFDPSSETGSPVEIVFIRIDPATQAVLTLNNGAAAGVIDLVATGYGRDGNGIKVKIETGSVTGKKITTQLGNAYFSEDNIARRALSVIYGGANATATMDVTATTLTLTDAAATAIALSDYPTIGALVERINAIPGYTAAVLDGNGEKPSLNGLDGVSAGNVKAGAVNVTANLQAVVDWFNGLGEGFVTATRAAAAITVPVNVPFTYLATGTDGAASNSDWQDAFDVLQAIDAQWIVPLSSNSAIYAMADAHVTFMSNVARMERRSIVGGGTGVADAAALLAAKAINSDRTAYTHLGIYDYNDAGALTLFPAYVAAAMIAGGFAGVNPGNALTNRSLKISGIERNLRNPTDTDQLIKGGVLCIENATTGYRVVKSISTWLNNANFNRVELSVATDYVARAVRNKIDELRGRKGSPTLLTEAVSRTDSVLRELAKPEPIGPGVLVGDKSSPPFKNITASLIGDVLAVEFQCSPCIPANYATVGIHVTPYSGVITT